MRPDVAQFIRSYEMCQKMNARMVRYRLWSIDFTGPLPAINRRSKYTLIGVEHLSGWSVSMAVSPRYFNSRGFLRFVEEIITPYGTPIFILSDNDSKFKGAPVREYSKENSIKRKCVSTYNPRGNARWNVWWVHSSAQSRRRSY